MPASTTGAIKTYFIQIDFYILRHAKRTDAAHRMGGVFLHLLRGEMCIRDRLYIICALIIPNDTGDNYYGPSQNQGMNMDGTDDNGGWR